MRQPDPYEYYMCGDHELVRGVERARRTRAAAVWVAAYTTLGTLCTAAGAAYLLGWRL